MSDVGVGNFLGAPAEVDIVDGLFNLNRFFRYEDAVATNIQPTDLDSLQSISPNAPSFQRQDRVYQLGGGNNAREIRTKYRYDGTMEVLTGGVLDMLSTMLGITYGSGGDYAAQMRMPRHPIGAIESIWMQEDGTHLFTVVYQDIILREFNPNHVMDGLVTTQIPFYAEHDSFFVHDGAELCYDKFDGDGSTVEFTLSATPLTAITRASAYADEDWVGDELVFVKVKESGDTEGTRQTSGVSNSTTTLTFTTAPTAGAEVEVLYLKATS